MPRRRLPVDDRHVRTDRLSPANPLIRTSLHRIPQAKGNAAFSAGRFAEAVEHFTAAIGVDPSNHVLYSNRSAAHASMGAYAPALEDAQKVRCAVSHSVASRALQGLWHACSALPAAARAKRTHEGLPFARVPNAPQHVHQTGLVNGHQCDECVLPTATLPSCRSSSSSPTGPRVIPA